MFDRLTNCQHYFRAGRPVSWRRQAGVWIAAATLAGFTAASAIAQYQGQVTEKDNKAPELRAVAVLEWTGEAGKPKKSRLVPITVFDGQQLQDGGLYLSRPEPLAVASEVEYQLKKDGKNIGLFDVENAAQEEGLWVGYGKWRPMPKPKPQLQARPAKIDDDEDSDKPVLHRKHQGGDSSSNGSGSGSGKNTSPPDPDRPTLHKSPDAGDSGSAGTSNAPTPDPDRPTLHKTSDESSSTDRPTLKKDRKEKTEDVGYVEDVPTAIDPNRPRLIRGKSTDSGPSVTPSLMGLPPDMEQAVAVSDPRNTPEHPWNYTWANPGDELKFKGQLEDIARSALGIELPPAPPVRKSKAKKGKQRMTLPPAPAPLEDEQFRALELAYGSGATLVLTAHTAGPLEQEKFVTLIAQPDLYGSLLVLFKSVTDGAHLDDTPRMRLVDAVDAMADNRGELLFELRGKTQRQFALYRILRGTAEKLFVSSPSEIAVVAEN